jgi:hypothetical protein
MKQIHSVKEAVYGSKIYYVVKYVGGQTKVAHHLSKEMEQYLRNRQ